MSNDFGRYIDHTLLRPTATVDDVRRLCREARDHAMAAVCLFPHYVGLAREILRNTRIKIATVIAFPCGVTFTEIKAAEMRAAAARGADEADFVINIAQLKSGDDAAVETEMQFLSDASRGLGVLSKFIIETGYLNDDEKLRVCRIANRVRPDFMKTSTGYGPAGARVEDVKLMRAALLPEIQIKASGGIRSHREALALLQAGASRIGTSSGVVIVEESRKV
jgi:deoxyribose-phosphate aldolase